MSSRRNTLQFIAHAAAATFMTATAMAAITANTATITAGKLQVSGTSTLGATITLDGKFPVSITAGAFSFSVSNYHPDDCVVDLRTNSFPTDPQVSAVIANCGLRGVTPRGLWKATTAFKRDDVVTYKGSLWRAKKAVAASTVGSTPGLDAKKYWEKTVSIGARGAVGPAGSQGAAGPQGATGSAGPQGPQGDVGPQGVKGAKGDTGSPGLSGLQNVPIIKNSSGTAASLSAVATCAAGKSVIGGGADVSSNAHIRSSFASSATQWTVVIDRNAGAKGALKMTASAICATVN